MAISPQDAAKLTDAEIEAAEELERHVDEELRARYVPGTGPVEIVIDSHLSYRVTEYVLRRYRALGWTEAYRNENERGNKHWIYLEAPHRAEDDVA